MRLLLILLSLTLARSMPNYDPDRLPYQASWGPYTVRVENAGRGDDASQRLRILDRARTTRIEVDDRQIMGVESVSLTGRGSDELRVTAFTGGAHCCSTDYFFSRREGLRTLLVFTGGNDGINAIRDLDGDGRPEILAGNDALAYTGDLSYAASPHLPLVLAWNGRRFVDRTAHFPRLVEARAREYRNALSKSAGKPGEDARDERRYGAAGYYACMLLLAKGPESARWIRPHLSRDDRSWFQRYQAEARAALAATPGKFRTAQRRVYRPSD